MNVAEITEKYLIENGFDGLRGEECGCALDELFICSNEGVEGCEPGYKVPCDCTENCEYHIGIKKIGETHVS